MRRLRSLLIGALAAALPLAAATPFAAAQSVADFYKNRLAEADKTQLEVNPASGEDVEKLVREVYATPADIVAKAEAAAK